MIRIGAVNIDTSHPMGFGEVMEKGDRARYVGVYNDSFRDDGGVDGFIHGCDWDDHLRCAMPFIQRGKPVFIDKPLVGNLRDLRRVEELSAGGAVILGASSARYAFEVRDFLAIPEQERGRIVQVFGTAGVDEFNYGVHIAECIGGILGTGAQAVRYMGRGQSGDEYAESYFVRYAGGQSAIFNTFTGVWQPFALTIMTTRTTYQLRLDSNRLYEALVEQICSYMEGKPHILAPVEELAESVRVMLAAAASRARGGKEVPLDALEEDGPSYDGRAFWESYGAASGPMYAAG